MMVVKVFRDDILDGLQKAANIIPAKTGAAFLRTIWLKAEGERLAILATDSSLEFCGGAKAQVQTEGLAGVQGRAFYDLVLKLPAGEITLSVEEGAKNLLVQQASRKYRLPVNDPSWFQPLAPFPESGAVFWSGDFLQDLIDKVAFCISDEDSMEGIACMNLVGRREAGREVVEVCGLNGHQFAMVRFVNDDVLAMLPEEGILLQKKYVAELKKWLTRDEIELALGDRRLFLRTADRRETFSLPLSNFQYPDYRGFLSKVMGDDNSRLAVDRAEMLAALERVAIFNSENNRCVNFGLDGQNLSLGSQGQDVGQASETLPAEYAGELSRIAFPTRNLIEILRHLASAKARFAFTGGEGPCGVSGDEDHDYLVVIMPMKVVEDAFGVDEAE